MLGIGKIKRIHFIGIGGIGMSGMAELLYRTGYSISGSDLRENDRTKFLDSIGLDIFIGHYENNVKDASLIVFSSAVNCFKRLFFNCSSIALVDAFCFPFEV